MEKIKKIVLSLLLAISVFSVGCVDAFAFTKNELKVIGNDVNTLIYSGLFTGSSSSFFVEGQTPSVDLIDDYVVGKLNWNEKYITNYDKIEEGEFPIYKVPASVFEDIILNSFDVNEEYLVNYRANFDISFSGFGEWMESKYYEENGSYYYTFQMLTGLGFAVEDELVIKGYKDLGNGKYEVLIYSVDTQPEENMSTEGLVDGKDYLVKGDNIYKINGFISVIVSLSNGYTKFFSYQVVESNNVSFDGLTICEQPTYDPRLDFLNGEKQEFNIEGNDLLTFRIDADVTLLDEVYIDTELVDPNNYTVKSGSTIITFNKEYTKKLNTGEHTLLVSYSDGTYAETTFTLNVNNPATFANVTEIVILGIMLLGTLLIITRRSNKVSRLK